MYVCQVMQERQCLRTVCAFAQSYQGVFAYGKSGYSQKTKTFIKLCEWTNWSGTLLSTMYRVPFLIVSLLYTQETYNVVTTSFGRRATSKWRCMLTWLDYSPADTQRWNNVDSTLIQRLDVELTLNRRCFNVVCLLGSQIKAWQTWKPK